MAKKKLRVPQFVKNWIQEIRKTNAEFEAASLGQKRVMLARDVILALVNNRIYPKTNTYMPDLVEDANVARGQYNDILVDSGEIDQDPVVITPYGESCEVCAKGALFVAKVDRLNGVTVGDFKGISTCDPSYLLHEYFSKEQLDLIECAFEQEQMRSGQDSEIFQRAVQFAGDDPSAESRMKKIMHNIIDNNGTFIP